MALTRTNVLIEALRDHLAALPLDPAQAGVQNAEPLFQRVGTFGAKRMADAMRSIFASEQRVCFIVPGGDSHTGTIEGRHLLSKRTTRLALLIADRSLVDADTALAGLLDLKDRTVHALCEEPAPGLLFEPGVGEPIVIEPADKPAGNLGRECWIQWISIPAGTARATLRF